MHGEPAKPLRLSRAQVRDVDRRSIDEYHVPGVVLMENAARDVTDVALEMLRGIDRPVALVVCGGGNNGGDGLAVARHLHNRRVGVAVALAVDPGTYRGDAAINWQIVEAMELRRLTREQARDAASRERGGVIIDALFGTGLATPPRSTEWINFMNGAGLPVLAVDLPSGLDCDTGRPLGTACVRATRTVTFVAEKTGFANPDAAQYLGQVTVGDIGCPREVVEAVAAT